MKWNAEILNTSAFVTLSTIKTWLCEGSNFYLIKSTWVHLIFKKINDNKAANNRQKQMSVLKAVFIFSKKCQITAS